MRQSFARGAVVMVLALATFARTGIAVAQTVADDQEAQVLFEAGVLAYNRAHFPRALEHFQRAYQLSQRPGLLFNIATVHDRMRNAPEALEAFERYLVEVPDASNAEFARGRVEVLRAELAAEAESEGSGPTNPTPELVEGASAVPPSSSSADPPTSSSADPPSSSVGGSGPSAAGIALVVTGGALIAGGVATTFWWVNRIDARARCAEVGCTNPDQLATERDGAAAASLGLYVLGAAVMVIGAVLVASGGDETTAGMSCAPSLSPELAGLTCAGRF